MAKLNPSANSSEQSSEQPQYVSQIHFCGGNKGGVGKSTLARTLLEWHLSREADVLGVDCDAQNTPDLLGCYRKYAEVIPSRFSDDRDDNKAANVIFSRAENGKKNIVVNLPATVHRQFKNWLTTNGIASLAKECRIRLIHWFVISGEYDSLKPLEISLKELGDQIPHVVVRNEKFRDWDFFEDSKDLQKLIEQYQCKVISLPYLHVMYASQILANRISFGGAAHPATQVLEEGQEPFLLNMIDRQNVWEYLKAAYPIFESTGYLPIA